MVAVQQHLRRCPLRRLLEIVFAWESLPLLMLLSRCGPCMQTLPLAQSRAVLRRSWHLPVGSRSLELHGGVPKRGLPFCEHQTTTAAGRSLRCTALALHYQASTIATAFHGVDEERLLCRLRWPISMLHCARQPRRTRREGGGSSKHTPKMLVLLMCGVALLPGD